MTGHRDPWLVCDGDDNPECRGEFPESAGESAFLDATIREVRYAAKQEGWRSSGSGRDYCPACIPAAIKAHELSARYDFTPPPEPELPEPTGIAR